VGCGSRIGLLWRLVGGVREKKKGDAKKLLFGRARVPCVVYVHYFKDIRQGALQSDCV